MTRASIRSAGTLGTACSLALLCAALVVCDRATMQAQTPDQAAAPAAPAAAPTSGVPFTPEPPLRSYVAIRRLESLNVRHKKEAWLVARTELKEDGTLSWHVLDEGGSELIRNRVLRESLEKEESAHRDGKVRRGGLTPDNYVFSAPTQVEGGVRVGLEPKRKDDMLLRGALLMSPDGELLRVEGDLVKRPSFWTKAVHLVRHYGRVDGKHVPVRIDLEAQVRLVGTSRLSMTYRYLQINGRPVQDESEQTSILTRAAAPARPAAPR
jgi:hypothetical protein